jgi:hypothetical protein
LSDASVLIDKCSQILPIAFLTARTHIRPPARIICSYYFDKKLTLINAIEAADKKPLGVCHGSELVLVFGQDELLLDDAERCVAANKRSLGPLPLLVLLLCASVVCFTRRGVVWRGRELSAQVQTYWSNFARYGSPNAPAAHQPKPTRNGSAVDVLEWPVASPRGAETSFSQCHCQAKKRIFVKTGSGQSHGKLKRKEVSLQEVLEEERCGSR